MKRNKLRITRQREIILEELRKLVSHPTADDLYEIVRSRLPHISLATVYRNLEWLADKELIQKIEVGGRQKRFDGNPAHHYHIRCVVCGRVADVDHPPLEALETHIVPPRGFTILGHRLELYGRCAECRAECSDAALPQAGQKPLESC